MTIEERLALIEKKYGTTITTAERQFIADMRSARRAGVGYGWMGQMVEWEWEHFDPKGALHFGRREPPQSSPSISTKEKNND